jgi:dsDNA-specific endonuclease/ATPase MutS2
MSDEPARPAPIDLPIDGVLDLHTFQPREVGRLIPAYLDECRRRGILEVRIIHGKGIGNLQRTVHSILARRTDVARYGFAIGNFGGIGATIVTLLPGPPGATG